MKRNAILTFASGYTLETIEPFLASWVTHVASAELVIFARDADATLRDAAARCGAWLLDPPGLRDYPVVTARNFDYRQFLTAYRRNFDTVLLSDCRDVVFQGDPFAVPRGNAVTFATEDNIIDRCVWNTMWLQMIYGGPIRESIAHETICCAGTTIGTTDGILRYLDLICAESDCHDTAHGEQCCHNVIAYRMRPDFIEIDNEDRIVATIGQTDPARVSFVDGAVLVDGARAPVIHQYDRQDGLVQRLRAVHRFDPARLPAAA